MRISGLRRYTLMSCVAAAMLAGCGQLAPLATRPKALQGRTRVQRTLSLRSTLQTIFTAQRALPNTRRIQRVT
jgi:hypothetical protein